MKPEFDFYSKTTINSYNLNESMRYQLGILDTLDAYTRIHSENVANICCRLCERMKFHSSFVIYCTTCAYLHDIGKTFIPAEILQKPGPLTDEEYEIMKKHTTIGYKMCMEDPKLTPYSAGPKYHHEALNGTGYPEKLMKDNIPIEGQIIRVADEFDAIVTKRKYKSHIGITDTLKILAQEAQAVMPKSVALKTIEESTKLGRLNPKIVKCLCKVVIEDINYEISCTYEYVKYLNEQINRLELINNYITKLQQEKKQSKKEYYEACIKMTLDKGEDTKNYKYVLEEYRSACFKRKEVIKNLFDEIKEIKKLRV